MILFFSPKPLQNCFEEPTLLKRLLKNPETSSKQFWRAGRKTNEKANVCKAIHFFKTVLKNLLKNLQRLSLELPLFFSPPSIDGEIKRRSEKAKSYGRKIQETPHTPGTP